MRIFFEQQRFHRLSHLQDRLRLWLKPYWQQSLTLLVAAVVIVVLWRMGWGQSLENTSYSNLFHWRGPLAWDQSIVMIEIDEASLQDLQTPPWSRQLYAKLIEQLAAADPAVIALDKLFVGLDPEDVVLAAALNQRQVLLAQAWTPDQQPILTNPQLIRATAALGHVVHGADADGMVRSVPTELHGLPSLGAVAAQLYQAQLHPASGQTGTTSLWSQLFERFFNSAWFNSAQAARRLWLNWEDRIADLPHYSLADLMAGRIESRHLRHKLILVGDPANNSPELFSTPYDRHSSSVYLQAAIASNLLHQDSLRPLGRLQIALLLLAVTLPLLLYTANWFWLHHLWLWPLLGGGWLGLGWLALKANVWLPIATPLLWFGLVGVSLLLLKLGAAFVMLKQNEARYGLMLQGFNVGIWEWDLKANRFYFSPRWKQMVGYSDLDLSDHPQEWFDRVHPHDRSSLDAAIRDYLEGIGSHFEQEYRLQHGDGSYRWMQGRGLIVWSNDGKAQKLVGSQVDITAQKQAEEELWRSTFFDRLTELPSWSGFVSHLEHAINQVQQDSQRRFAVLWLDLDQFKLINNSLGNTLGDRLLLAIAQRLKSLLSANQVVARLGEDEFAILLKSVPSSDAAVEIAQQIQQSLACPFNLDDHEVFVSASVGIVLSAPYYLDPEHLLRDAGTAMYRAKAMGRASCLVFDKSMRTGMLVKLRLESDLRRAIAQGERQSQMGLAASSLALGDAAPAAPVSSLQVEEIRTGAIASGSAGGPASNPASNPAGNPASGALTSSTTAAPDPAETLQTARSTLNAKLNLPSQYAGQYSGQYPGLELYYQPIVQLSTGQVAGFEALVRWQHAEQGLLFPSRFISMAEETGLIIPLSWWVLRTACRQMSYWRRLFPGSRALTMSVNLSSKQFSMLDLSDRIHQILEESNLDPTSLKLELTESMVIENAASVIDILYQLRTLGIQLAIDDFGTGYSSLSYLPRFPLTTLKIDRSFVEQIGDCNDNLEIVRTILALAHKLRMDVVAEGVETEAQAVRLREMGCEYGQGFFFYKPLNVEAATQLLAK
jgi:diguanylate cyclase (GGDEF)-like protein/PAS domain S-box-containing protein